jgi:radical SAM superfamily enzyme YgiQ (UPF0313 family)
VLLVYPRFTRNNLFGYENMVRFYPGKRAVMPPLGLLVFAARLDETWDVRMVDENVRPLLPGELEWADVVALSGMHPQRRRLVQILEEANRLCKITVIGGPSANICPEYYPMADAVHVGEMGDATDRLLEWLGRTCAKPPVQLIFRTEERTPLDEQPLPRLDVLDVNDYFTQPVQFSSGCPFTCEFCDIPMIYGRIARIKSGHRIVRELQAIYETGFVGSVVFVDDNLIANRRALRAMLPELIEWQRANAYPYALSGESSVNLARDEELLVQLRDARFTHIFFGVESPEPGTLVSISKKQNVMDPMLDSLRSIESHGIEVLMGMILGFDTDTPRTGEAMVKFIEESNAPIVYFNLLAALPKTPLWNRLTREGRLLEGEGGDTLQSESLLSGLASNMQFKLGNDLVKEMLRETVRGVYSPEQVYRRMLWNARNVYGKQVQGLPPAKTWKQRKHIVRFTLVTLVRVLRDIGLHAPYRRLFWRYAADLAKLRWRGRIRSFLEVLLRTTPMAHHLIEWGRILLRDASAADPAAQGARSAAQAQTPA